MRSGIASALSRLRPKRSVSVTNEPRAGSGGGTCVPVLVISRRAEDHLLVRKSLANGRWLVIEARDWGAALSLSQCLVFPVIVCDREFRGLDAHMTVRTLAGAWRTASVILLSDRWDAALWESLLQQGGFDLLTRPLHEDDILAVVDTAYRDWAEGRPGISTDSPPSTMARLRAAS